MSITALSFIRRTNFFCSQYDTTTVKSCYLLKFKITPPTIQHHILTVSFLKVKLANKFTVITDIEIPKLDNTMSNSPLHHKLLGNITSGFQRNHFHLVVNSDLLTV